MQIYSPIAQDSLVVSGSAFVSGSVTAQSFIGSFSGTASYAANALTSSYALTASVALNVPATASYALAALTASYSNFAANTTSASFAVSAAFASQASIASSASYATNAGTAGSASFATNASTAASASYAISASYATASAFANNSTSASYALSASYAVASSTAISSSFATVAANASSASYALNSSNTISASFARSASYAMSASYATASSFATTASYAVFAATATTASFATNASTAASASFATNAGTAGSASYAVSASYATASSFASSASYALNASNAVTASHALNSVSASYALFAANSTSASYALSASYAFNSSVAISASYATNAGFAGSASFATNASTAASASYATNAGNAGSASFATQAANASSASYALNTSNATSASFATSAANATTASYAQQANTASSADNFTVRGTLTAQTLVVQTITSSVSLITGSTVFGQLGTNTHQFTGSLRVSGSGNHWILGGSVGVGVSSPYSSLDVYSLGDTGAYNALTLRAGNNYYSSGSNQIIFGYNGEANSYAHVIKTRHMSAAAQGNAIDFYVWKYGTDAVGTLGTQHVMSLNGGSVGIGTISPAYTLDVNGNARILGGSTYLGQADVASGHLNAYELMTFNIDIDNDDTNRYFAWYKNAADGAGTELMRLGEDGHLILKSTTAGGGTQADFYVIENGGLVIDSSEGATQRYIEFTTGGTTKVLIKADGNVGIGTTDPTSKLHILYPGDNAAGIRLQGDGTDNTLEFRTNNNVAHIQAYTGSAFTTGSFLALNASGGNVGINTAAPNAILHIHGTAERRYFNINAIAGFAGIGSGSDAMALVNNTGDGNTLLVRTNNSSRNDAAPFAVWTENNSRFIILNTGSIGIGTTVPTGRLDVSPGGSVTAGDLVVNTANKTVYIGRASGTNDDNSIFIVRDRVGTTKFYVPGGSGENSYFAAGNVGIGTTAVRGLLSITPTSTGQRKIVLYDGGLDNDYQFYGFGIEGNTLLYSVYDLGDKHLFVAGSGTSSRRVLMVVSGSGCVGIGTSTPTDKLHVESGRISITEGGTYGLSLIASGSGGRGGIIQTKAASDWNNAIIINSSGNVGIGMGAPAYQLDVLGNLMTNFYTSGNPSVYIYENGAGSNGGTVDLYDRATGTVVTRLAGAPGLNSYFNNSANVGIGTTSPTTLLHIKGLNPILNVETTWASGNYGQIRLGYVAGSNRSITGHYDDGMTFDVNGERMRINPSGYVGINTTSPGSYLEIDDEDGGQQMLRVRNYAVGSTGNFTGHYMVELRSAWTTGAASGSLLVHSQEANDDRAVMAVSDSNGIFTRFVNGKVGIGSTIPETKLDISGATRITNSSGSGNFLRIRSTTANYGGQVDFYESNTLSHAIVSTGANNTFYIRDEYNAATRLLINSAGNVGIGTTAPSSKLHVVGAGAVSTPRGSGFTKYFFTDNNAITTYFEIQTPSSSAGDILFSDGSGGDYGIVGYDHTTDSMRIYTKSAITMFISGSGNVGIGNTTPAAYLDVRGYAGNGSSSLLLRGGNASDEFNSNQITLGYNNTSNYRHAIKTRHHDGAYTNAIDFYVWKYGTDANGTVGTQHVMTIIQGSASIADTGRVGIGSQNPAYKLDVIGTIRSTERGYFGNSMFIGEVQGSYSLIESSNGIWVRAGGIASPGGLFVNTNGNVGIGTTNPDSKLRVEGRIYTTGTAGSANAIFQGGQLEFYKDATPTYAASIGLSGPASGGTNDIVLNTYNGAWSERMRITTGGNVGIGSFSPSATLDVSGSSVDFVIPATATLPGAVPFTINSTGTARSMTGNAGGYSFGDNTMLTLIAGDDVQTHLALWRASNTATGSSGFGGSKLVGYFSRGSMAAPASVGDDDIIFSVEGWAIHGAGPNKGKFGAGMRFVKDDDFGTASTYAPQRTEFYNAVNTTTIQTNMTILPNGNVGIGSATPGVKLDVIGTVRSYSSSGNYGQIANGSFQAVGDHGGTYMLDLDNTGAADLVNIKKSGTSRLFIANGGNVGIGLTNPSARLDVYSVGDTSGVASLTLRGGNSSDTFTGNQIRLAYNSTPDYSHAIKTRHHSGNYLNAIDFYVWKYGTDATTTIGTQHVMTLTQGINGVDGGGRVGIGTAYPAYKLDVSGDIRATADVIAYSDARVKTNVKTIESPLEIVSKLRGVTYNRIDIEDKSEKVGVIAQEVLEVLPQVVQQDHEGNYSVAYGNIVGVLIEAIKELKAEINELKNNKQ